MRVKCAGVGVGPSNLSLACLLFGQPGLSGMFFDRKPEFSWHEGLMIPGATIQVALFKDLVTLADPRNRFSFISYLHETGRLYHFLNARFDEVPRQEFSNYMKWASRKNSLVNFGEDVVNLALDDDDDLFLVQTTKRSIKAECVSIAVGTEPYVPDFSVRHLDTEQFHVCEFAWKGGHLARKRVVVVGGGQSGAEAFLNLISRDDDRAPRQVAWVSRRENFLPMDDSPFTNEYFMPCHSENFFARDHEYRTSFVKRNVLASDGISERTLREIYQRIYTLQLIDGKPPQVILVPNRAVQDVRRDGAGWMLKLDHLTFGHSETLDADVVIWATGYRPARMNFLAPLAHRFDREGNEIRINDNFAARWDGPKGRYIFLLNTARIQRGLADPNLSLMAWRSQRVIDCMRGVSNPLNSQLPAFISWSQDAAAAKRASF